MATDPSSLLGLIVGGGPNPYNNQLRSNQDVQQGAQQLQQGQQQLALGKLQISLAEQQQIQQQHYQTDVQNYFADPKPGVLANLIAKYPQQAAALKESKAALDEPQKQSQLTQFGQVYNAASSGRTDLLLKQITNIQQAEKTAGIDTSEVDDLIGQLQSKDPAAVKVAHNSAIAFSQAHLAALDPKFEEALTKGHEGYTLSQGQGRYDANNNLVASVAPKPDYLVVPEGGKAIPLNGAPALDTGGGGQASGSGGGTPNSTTGSPRYTGGWTPRARNGGDNTDAQVDNKIAGAAKALGVDPDADIRSLSPAQIAQAMAFGEGGAGTLAGRNANPTNMRNTDGSYKKFNSPQAGLTAAASLVARKLQRGQTTVRSMIEGLPVGGQGAALAPQRGGPQPGDPAGTVYGNPKTKDAPSGYRWGADGSLQAIPGGPADKEGAGLPGDPSLTGGAYLATLPAQMQAAVKAVSEGRAAAPRPGTRNGEALLNAVTQYDPTFDAANSTSRIKTRVDFTSGKSAQAVNALNTAMGHLLHLDDQAHDLGNFETAPGWLNPIYNYAREKGGNTALPAFDQTKQAAASEMRKVFAGAAGGSQAELDAWEAQLSSSKSYPQLHSVIKNGVELMGSRLGALQDQYATGMGRSDKTPQFIKPSISRATKSRFGIDFGGAAPAQAAPAQGGGFRIIGVRPKQ